MTSFVHNVDNRSDSAESHLRAGHSCTYNETLVHSCRWNLLFNEAC